MYMYNYIYDHVRMYVYSAALAAISEAADHMNERISDLVSCIIL